MNYTRNFALHKNTLHKKLHGTYRETLDTLRSEAIIRRDELLPSDVEEGQVCASTHKVGGSAVVELHEVVVVEHAVRHSLPGILRTKNVRGRLHTRVYVESVLGKYISQGRHTTTLVRKCGTYAWGRLSNRASPWMALTAWRCTTKLKGRPRLA